MRDPPDEAHDPVQSPPFGRHAIDPVTSSTSTMSVFTKFWDAVQLTEMGSRS